MSTVDRALLRRVAFAPLILTMASCASLAPQSPQLISEEQAEFTVSEDVSQVDPDAPLATLIGRDVGCPPEQLAIHEPPQDAGLLLTSAGTSYRIAESWQLFEFERADWGSSESCDEVIVFASFATGMGPGGGHPFRAKIRLRRKPSGWSTVSTVILTEPHADEDRFDGLAVPEKPLRPYPYEPRPIWKPHKPFVEFAGSPEEVHELSKTRSARLADLQIDFGRERLVLASIWLTSGSNSLVNVRVQKHDDGYDVTYKVKKPRIGTADIKRSGIYVVLPADGRRVKVFERGRGDIAIGDRVDVLSGVIARLSD